jgi:hypothetical protein
MKQMTQGATLLR